MLRTWNRLFSTQSPTSFCRQLKTFLFHQYFPDTIFSRAAVGTGVQSPYPLKPTEKPAEIPPQNPHTHKTGEPCCLVRNSGISYYTYRMLQAFPLNFTRAFWVYLETRRRIWWLQMSSCISVKRNLKVEANVLLSECTVCYRVVAC